MELSYHTEMIFELFSIFVWSEKTFRVPLFIHWLLCRKIRYYLQMVSCQPLVQWLQPCCVIRLTTLIQYFWFCYNLESLTGNCILVAGCDKPSFYHLSLKSLYSAAKTCFTLCKWKKKLITITRPASGAGSCSY